MKTKLKSGLMAMVLFLSTIFSSVTNAQEEQSNFSFGADLVSRYIWRGINLGGSSPHIQPSVEYSFGSSGLAIGAWGSQSIGASATGAEADLYITYSFLDMFSLGVTDYYFPSDGQFARDGYFDYNKDSTKHTIEIMASFGGTESFPISLLFAMNVYGYDGRDENGDAYHSKYIELGYSKTLADMDLSVFVGAALDDPKGDDAYGFYGNSAGIINLGLGLSKSVKITEDYSLPLSSSVIFNPEAENFYLTFGISF